MQNSPQSIPDVEAIRKAASIGVLDEKGERVKFRDLIKDRTTIVVFIRHFFCGSCQAFVEHLASVPAESLAQSNAQIVVIGCGDWKPIAAYRGITTFTGPIYTDPSRALYRALGMNTENLARTPRGETRKSYLTLGFFANTLRSIYRALRNPTLIGKQGNFSQLGGDFVFGPGIKCSFASRMRHTEDHTELADLMLEAGAAYPSGP